MTLSNQQSRSGGPSREERLEIIEDSPYGDVVAQLLFEAQERKRLNSKVKDEEDEWLYRLIDAATTLVACVNGCTPYIDMRKAATKLDKILKEGEQYL